MKLLLTAVITFFAVTFSFAQLEKTIHQTFEVGEADKISLDLYGEYELIFWAGNNIMSETKIELYSSSASIFNHFIDKEQRYLIQTDTTNGILTLQSHDKKRVAIRTKNGECTEIVHLRLFIPDKFAIETEKTLVKSE